MGEFDLPERPLLVRFDEGNHLLKEWTFPKDQQELVYQAQHDDVIGRAWAIGELRRFSDDPKVEACLTERARADPFWAVRRTAVETLHAVRPGGHDDLLRTLVADPSSKVRVAALRSLAASGRGELLSLFRERFEQDDSYLAQAEALRGVGKVGGRENLPFLRSAAAVPSPRGVLRQAAEQAIAEIVGE